MRKLFLTVLLGLACLNTFAQGHISFGNDAGHLIVLSPNPGVLPDPWSSMAGLAVPQAGDLNPQNMGLFTAEIMYGASSADVTHLGGSFAGAGIAGFAAGRLANRNMTIADLTGGVAAFFQVRIYETAAGSYANAGAGFNFLFGESPIFSSIPGASLPNSIVLPGAPSHSTWAPDPIVLTANVVPEPSTLALSGLGLAVWFIVRRKNEQVPRGPRS